MHNAIFHFRIAGKPFIKIVNGSKIRIVKLDDDKLKRIKYGDLIVFEKLPDIERRITTRVIDVQKFNCFENLYSHYALREFGIDENKTIRDVVKGMYKTHSRAQELENGVLCIKIELVWPSS